MVTKVRYFSSIGAELSVLPANSNDRLHEPAFHLQAANWKPIATYCRRFTYLKVELNKLIHLIFVVADAFTSVIGKDPPQHHNLLIDTRKRRLVDEITKL